MFAYAKDNIQSNYIAYMDPSYLEATSQAGESPEEATCATVSDSASSSAEAQPNSEASHHHRSPVKRKIDTAMAWDKTKRRRSTRVLTTVEEAAAEERRRKIGMTFMMRKRRIFGSMTRYA